MARRGSGRGGGSTVEYLIHARNTIPDPVSPDKRIDEIRDMLRRLCAKLGV